MSKILYVVEHANGSGPMSIPLSLEEAREFAVESNLPYKIEAVWADTHKPALTITPDQKLFVVSETHS